MSKYDLPDLIRKWELEEVTIEQIIGQLLLHLEALLDRLTELERQVEARLS